MPVQSTKLLPDQIVAAKEELDALDVMAQGVSAQISDLSKRPQSLGHLDVNDLALIDQRRARQKAFEELAHRVYGRTVIGTELDGNDLPKGSFTYRITQANVGFTDKGCYVLPRNSRLASELVSAQPGDRRDVEVPAGERYFSVHDVRTLDGPVNLRSSNESPNFRSMAIRKLGSKRPLVVDDLRSTVSNFFSSPQRDDKEATPSPQKRPFAESDPAWLIDWVGIYLGDTDDQSLGHQFITRTTVDQERALSNPRGVTFVEGIAGAGKASVALGRLKFFANFGTGVERDSYGLQNASDEDFSSAGMVGFVLSHSLRGYLKETAAALELVHLPIKDFEEFRGDLFSKFGISNQFRRKKGADSLVRCRIEWLRALDVIMAHEAAIRLQRKLSEASAAISPRVIGVVSKISADLLKAGISREIRSFYLGGLAARIVTAISEAETQDQEDRVRAEFRVIEKADNQRRRNEEAALNRELDRVQAQAEKKLMSTLARSFIADLNSSDLLRGAVGQDAFSSVVREAFAFSSRPVSGEVLDQNVNEVRGLFTEGGDRPSLPECDLVVLAIFAGMISDGFEYTDQGRALSHLYQMRRYNAVFIDEVQDFTESEILLMGMSADSKYNQITLSGDRCQQLQAAGAQKIDDLFPWVPRSARNKTIFLDQNFRQRTELAGLSAGFRSAILGDDRIKFERASFQPAVMYQFEEARRMADFIVARIRNLPHHATIAIIMPTVGEAQQWFDLLDDDLGAYHRPALMSRRNDLTKRVNVHFTEVRETKGLEFDVVIIPNVGSYDLNSPIGRNQVYVAVSRAKQSLMIGCAASLLDRAQMLEGARLVSIQSLP
ncbi:ATP-binding domain-containing protein [Rhodopseudomonas palustris]|uniref:ATP-binding domain-containing protein n=1 Tax=Rhodopseudomonas palustris TaxID=1076 RepID=UPI0021F261AA|nr:ATP-binding domain-containing protein [Rhodopseudomonas palustris]UYO45689.1 ATP-binding domain-containing protein [Rhodopseudomonas palustris]